MGCAGERKPCRLFISSHFSPCPCTPVLLPTSRHAENVPLNFFYPLSFPCAFRSIAFPHQNGSQRRQRVVCGKIHFPFLFFNYEYLPLCFVFSPVSSNMRRLLLSSGSVGHTTILLLRGMVKHVDRVASFTYMHV
jgi:hypothetical protein